MKRLLVLLAGFMLVCTNALAFDPLDPPTLTKDLNPVILNTPIHIAESGILGDFYHKYTLTLPQAGFSMALVSLQFAPLTQINDFAGYFYNADSLDKIFEVTGPSLIHSEYNLAPGNYFLALTGTGLGTILEGGMYDGLLIATNPVPLPGAAFLLGAGVLGLVGLRRRNREV